MYGLLVVLILEIDVRLQERGIFEGLAFKISNYSKFVLYGILFAAAVFWGLKGDFIDFWDAFLWLVAFFFIELNVIEWREEDKENKDLAANLSESSGFIMKGSAKDHRAVMS